MNIDSTEFRQFVYFLQAGNSADLIEAQGFIQLYNSLDNIGKKRINKQVEEKIAIYQNGLDEANNIFRNMYESKS